MLNINEVKVGDKLVYIARGSHHGATCTVIGFVYNYPGIRFITEEGYKSHCYVSNFKRYVQPQQTKEQQMISMDKIYRTRDGRKVRVLCVDMKSEKYPVVALVESHKQGEYSSEFTVDGLEYENDCGCNDLIEYNPASELKMDQAIWVRDSKSDAWLGRHFKDLNSRGQVQCWVSGATSHSADSPEDAIAWSYWSVTKPE